MLYIRADANEMIGTGHVMRCLSIAEEARRKGQDVVFIHADERTRPLVEQRGFSGICLHSVWDDLEQETDRLISLIQEKRIGFLLIDSYYVTEIYLNRLRTYTKIACIDDLHPMIYPADLLINYNFYEKKYDYKGNYRRKGYDTVLLLGTLYAPLREEFRNRKKKIRERAGKILITSGGTDRYHVINRLLAALKEKEWFDEFEYYVIIGRFNEQRRELKENYEGNFNIHLLENISNIQDYMEDCDFAITAGGVTTYELCACGIPAIMYTVADNQLELARSVSELGIIPWAGDVRGNFEACIENILVQCEILRSDSALRKRRSLEMRKLVDGNGCKRILEAILSYI